MKDDDGAWGEKEERSKLLGEEHPDRAVGGNAGAGCTAKSAKMKKGMKHTGVSVIIVVVVLQQAAVDGCGGFLGIVLIFDFGEFDHCGNGLACGGLFEVISDNERFVEECRVTVQEMVRFVEKFRVANG